MIKEFDYTPDTCYSIHKSPYVLYSYWDEYDIICGACGFRIKNPLPEFNRFVYEKGIRGIFGKGHYESVYPDWLDGKRGKKWDINNKGGRWNPYKENE